MPTLNPLCWLAEQNTKVPALTHMLSYRVQLPAANTAATLNIPTAVQNPAQAVFPGISPTGSPQAGRRLFVTEIVLRDANGSVGGTAGGSVALVNVTQANAVVATVTSPTTTGANPPYIRSAVQTGSIVVNPGDQLAVQYTPPTAGTAVATGFTVDVFGYVQQGI